MERVETQGVKLAGIEIRHCRTLEEYDDCVRLEQITWGEGIVVPSAIFVVAQETGGQVLGAFEGKRLAGFTLALAGVREGQPFLHSHMTAVLPEFQNRGIGRLLKLAQRSDALQRGIGLVEWTFDPLELKNARFNLDRLGAVARRFIPNCYGITDSPVHAGLPTDRLVAEWWLCSRRVVAVLEKGKPSAGTSARDSVRIPVPANIARMKREKREEAARVQREIRGEFERWLGRGYIATGIKMGEPESNYVLEPGTTITRTLERD